MYDLNFIVSDSELILDFIEQGPDKYIALDKLTKERKGEVIINGCTFQASDDNVFMQYKLWLTRPERSVGKKVEIDLANLEDMKETYEELLIGAYILNSGRSIDAIRPHLQSILQWIEGNDFFTAPASTQYHESFPGGLLIHSLKVYNEMVDLITLPAFASVSVVDATIGALTHDWCKIGMYESYIRNVKNDATGQWDKVTAYKHNPKGVTLGHGVTSMYLASRCFKLSPELAAAIRWHMSVWDCCEVEKSELQNCNAKYPIVYLLQFADQLAITEYCNSH